MNSNFENSPSDPIPKKSTAGMNSKPFQLKKGSVLKKDRAKQ